MLLLVTGLLPSLGLATLIALAATVTPAKGWPPRLMFLTYTAWTVAIAINQSGCLDVEILTSATA
jgi:hypothetical protein